MNSESILLLLGEWLAKGVVVLLAAGLVARILRSASAAQRHLVWLAAITILLILPATRLMTPRWKVALGDKPQRSTITLPMTTVAPVVDLAPLPQLPVSVPKKSAPWRLPDWRKLALGVWLTGACGIVGARLLGSWRLRGLKQRAASLKDEFIVAAAERVFCDFGLGRAVAVRVSSECRVPMTWGLWRPVLLLPVEALEWSGTRITAALQHEAGHILRRDYLTRWLAHLACAVYWPNPLVWLAARALRISQEQATDDLVLRTGASPEDYASQLFDTARTVAAHGMFTRHAVAMASPSTLEDRVLAIVDAQRDRRPLSRLAAALGVMAVAMTLAICTAAQVRGADPAPPARSGDAGAPDTERRPQQVEIETKFVEITGELQDLDGLFTPPQGVFTDPQFQVIIRGLNQRKGVDLLSAPRVTTKSKQLATIEIVRDFRYPTDWKRNEKGVWAPVEFATKPTGVTLEVTPEVKRDGSIDLQLKTSLVEFVSFTDIDPAEARPPDDDTIGKRQKPNFDERKLEAKGNVGDRHTLALSYPVKLRKRGGGKEVACKLVVFVSARIIDANPPHDKEAAKSALKERVDQIIIPKLEFREKTVEECIAILRKESVEHSADGKGVNIVVKDGAHSDARITVTLTNIPLAEALRYVAGLANLKFKMEPYAVALVPEGEAEPLMTKEWKVAPDMIPLLPSGERKPAKEWLIEQGVVFKDAATAVYIPRTSRLIARNNQDQLDLIDVIVEAGAKGSEPDKKAAKAEEPKEPAATEMIRSKLEGTIIPKLEWRDVPVAEVVDLLNKRARELDPAGKGVEIVLKPGAGREARITLSLSNVPLVEALRYVASLSNLQVVVEPNQVVLQPAAAGAAIEIRVEGDKREAVPAKAALLRVYGMWVPGKPGFVVSPFDVTAGYIDVRGFKPETEVKCPYTGQIFRVPPLPLDAEGANASERPGPSPVQEGPKESRIEGRVGVQIKSGNAVPGRGPIGRSPGQN